MKKPQNIPEEAQKIWQLWHDTPICKMQWVLTLRNADALMKISVSALEPTDNQHPCERHTDKHNQSARANNPRKRNEPVIEHSLRKWWWF